MEDCIFCKKISGGASTDNVYESENFLVFRDINEVAKGHSLLVPKKHIASFLEMDEELYSEFVKTTKAATEKIMKDHKHESFNLLLNDSKAAGQVIPHMHMHIIPRNAGDGYELGP